MKSKKVITAVLAFTAALAFSVPCYADWHETDDHRWYYTNDETGLVERNCWIVDDDDWFIMGPDGFMVTNRWVYDGDDEWYFAGPDGYLLRGRYKIPEHSQYYSRPSGAYVSTTIKAGSYTFDADGLYYK